MVNKTITIAGTSIASYINRDGYSTQLVPVFGASVTTMDGVEHTSVLRYKNSITLSLNPMTQEDTQTLCALLLAMPSQVGFYSLQKGYVQYANMKPTTLSAEFLSRCLKANKAYNSVSSITLEEL